MFGITLCGFKHLQQRILYILGYCPVSSPAVGWAHLPAPPSYFQKDTQGFLKVILGGISDKHTLEAWAVSCVFMKWIGGFDPLDLCDVCFLG